MLPSLRFPLHTSLTVPWALPDSLLLQILSRLDNSADVARCRVASKAFDTVFPDLRTINIHMKRSTSASFERIVLYLTSKLKIVESVCIRNVFCLTDGDFGKEWVPRVSESLKSLSLSVIPHDTDTERQSNVLPLISACCHNLVSLTLGFAWLSMDNLNPMPMLTTLTLYSTRLDDQHLNELNKCFPNLQALNLVRVVGLKDPKIQLFSLQTCLWVLSDNCETPTLITPNLITLTIECIMPAAIHVEAPMLSCFLLNIHAVTFTAKKFENLTTLCLGTTYTGFLLSEFPITKTVETLILDSGNSAPTDTGYSQLTMRKVFMVFPNVSSLCIKSGAWSELEACLNPEGWEILNGRKGLTTIGAYLELDDPSLTFSSVSRLLDQCVGLSKVSLLIHGDVVDTESRSFMSKCMARWPGLKWRWGIWSEDMKDSWITDGMSN